MDRIRTLSSLLLLTFLILCGSNAMAQTPAIAVGSGSGLPGAGVTIPVGFTAGATSVSTLQFDLIFSSSIVYSGITTGAAATAASKSASANPIAGGLRVLVFGLNTNVIGSGAIAGIQFTISGSAPAGAVPIAITGIVASDPSAVAVTTTGSAGSVQVQAPADATPPTISSVASSSITSSGATITWTTNEASNTQVDYGTTSGYGSSTALNGNMVTSHAQGLTGLTSGTLYHYRVRSRDAAGNLSISADYTFTTTAVADTTPPTISSPTASGITSTGALIIWTTNEDSDTQVDYGTTTSYGSTTALDGSMVTSHAQALTGLTAKTLYHYRVKSKDAAGNLAISSDNTFTTSADSGAVPVISALSVMATSTSATITWTTDKPSNSAAEYWTGTRGQRRAALDKLVTRHSLILNGLKKLTTYQFRVKSADSGGNQAVSPELSFTTTARSAPFVSLPLLPSEYSSLQVLGTDEDSMIGFALTNTGFGAATLTFTAVDSSGNLIHGYGITNPSTRELQAGAQASMLDSDIFGEGIRMSNPRGWIKMESTSSDIRGFFLILDSGPSYMDGASFGDVSLSNLLFPEIQPNGATKINVANPNPENATITFDLMKADGTIRSSRIMELRANGAFVGDLYGDVFPGTQPNPTDYVLMDSTAGVQAFELMQSFGDVASLTGQNAMAGGTTLYSPQYVTGDPWRTRLSIVNLDSQPGAVTLRLFGESGMPIGKSRTVPIAANGKIYIDDPEFFTPLQTGAITSGYVTIESDGVRLAGSTVFGDSTGQSCSSALPLIDNLVNSVLYSHVASSDMYFTGVAIVNPNEIDANVVMEIIGTDGTVIERRVDVLPAGQKKARLLTEYFPTLVGKDQRSGFIRIYSDQPTASFSLFGTNNLSVLSAIPPQ
jgi:hypothetical protein